jgi:hypothetical protein
VAAGLAPADELTCGMNFPRPTPQALQRKAIHSPMPQGGLRLASPSVPFDNQTVRVLRGRQEPGRRIEAGKGGSSC